MRFALCLVTALLAGCAGYKTAPQQARADAVENPLKDNMYEGGIFDTFDDPDVDRGVIEQ
ncbi:MAG: hypothetical protein ACM33T_16930 [Solirubrobacterales bacterium]